MFKKILFLLIMAATMALAQVEPISKSMYWAADSTNGRWLFIPGGYAPCAVDMYGADFTDASLIAFDIFVGRDPAGSTPSRVQHVAVDSNYTIFVGDDEFHPIDIAIGYALLGASSSENKVWIRPVLNISDTTSAGDALLEQGKIKFRWY